MLKTSGLLLLSLIVAGIIIKFTHLDLSPEQWKILFLLFKQYVFAALLCFVVSEASGNYSQVDKLWSLMPMVYSWTIFSFSEGDKRVLLMSVLISLWGIRLSYNFWRRGGYSWPLWKGEEDYRWAILRKRKEFKSPAIWRLFNLVFICLYQMGLILLFTLPVLAAFTGKDIGWIDGMLAVLFLCFLLMETIADQQQWVFQQRKKELLDAGSRLSGEYSDGFVRGGLWRKIRHPNYTAEQAIWIVVYLFSVVATGQWWNASGFGWILLLLLFRESARFSEGISASKYPAYKNYCSATGRFIPRLFASKSK